MNAGLRVERRRNQRFDLNLPVSFSWQMLRGRGETSNVAASGTLFVSSQELPVCTIVKLTINFDPPFDQGRSLRLVVVGEVLRCERRANGKFALALHHQSHTVQTAVAERPAIAELCGAA